MFKSIAENLSLLLVTSRHIKPEDREFYTYGLELLAAELIFYAVVLLFSLLTGTLAVSVLFVVLYMFLRQYSGGYHSKTAEMCFIISVMIYLIMILLVQIDIAGIRHVLMASSAVSFVVITLLSPVENANKPLTQEEKKTYRFIAILAAALFTALCAVSFVFGWKELFYSLSWALTVDAVLLILSPKKSKGNRTLRFGICYERVITDEKRNT